MGLCCVAKHCGVVSAAIMGNCGLVVLVFAILHHDLAASALEVFCERAGDSLVCKRFASRFAKVASVTG